MQEKESSRSPESERAQAECADCPPAAASGHASHSSGRQPSHAPSGSPSKDGLLSRVQSMKEMR